MKKVFIVAVFGDRFVGMLLNLLYSIERTQNDFEIKVYWQDMSDDKISPLKLYFDKVNFIETKFDFKSSRIERIASKTKLWNFASENNSEDNLVFVDVDTLFIKDIDFFFKQDFDVIYTVKEEKFPLNTGIILCKNSIKVKLFFKVWLEKTMSILNNPVDFSKANDDLYPYGAPDQMAFFKLINLDVQNILKDGNVSIGSNSLNIKPVSCKLLNETNSTTVMSDTYMIHFKGGWQPILIDGATYSINRPLKKSLSMHKLYLRSFLTALDLLNVKLSKKLTPSFFNIKIPNYFYNDLTIKRTYFFYKLVFLTKLCLVKFVIRRSK